MDPEDIESRVKFLVEFLELPPPERLVRQMSGGQQRRLSFAVALLHMPRLLILDEPTVGVQSILRARIWQHLAELASGPNPTTIIVTTHYIEEARQSAVVAFMHNGRLLAEDAPGELLARYSANTLEDVFLTLCVKETGAALDVGMPAPAVEGDEAKGQETASSDGVEAGTDARRSSAAGISRNPNPIPQDAQGSPRRPRQTSFSIADGGRAHAAVGFRDRVARSVSNTKTVVYKNITRMRRNYGFLAFQFLLPCLQIILFCLAIGADPKGLRVAIYNADQGFPADSGFNFTMSGRYLAILDHNVIHQVPVFSPIDGRDRIRRGDCWGMLEFGANYSVDLFIRATHAVTDLSVIYGSSLNVTLDATDQQIAISIEQKVSQAFEILVASTLQDLGMDPTLGSLPVVILDPVYGSRNPSFTDFIAPGMIVSISFGLSIGLTALAFVLERKDGLLDRMWGAGVRPVEVLLGHVITQSLVLMVQTTLLLFFALFVFKVPLEGSLALVALAVMLIGLAGMAYGILISAVSQDEIAAIQVALGSFYPVLLLSGVIWPTEAMPVVLKYVSYILPTTWSSSAMRSVLGRGWGMDHFDVWMGYLIPLAWLIVLAAVAARCVRSMD
eukprot:Opistho-1_new@62267